MKALCASQQPAPGNGSSGSGVPGDIPLFPDELSCPALPSGAFVILEGAQQRFHCQKKGGNRREWLGMNSLAVPGEL